MLKETILQDEKTVIQLSDNQLNTEIKSYKQDKEVKKCKPGSNTTAIRPHTRKNRAGLTLEAIQRIGKRMGKGLTAEQACLLEIPPFDDVARLHNALNANPAFRIAHKLEMARWIELSIDIIHEGDPAGLKRANGIQYLLERRNAEQFGKQPSVQVTNTTTTVFANLPPGINDALAKERDRLRSLPAIEVDTEAQAVTTRPAKQKRIKE